MKRRTVLKIIALGTLSTHLDAWGAMLATSSEQRAAWAWAENVAYLEKIGAIDELSRLHSDLLVRTIFADFASLAQTSRRWSWIWAASYRWSA